MTGLRIAVASGKGGTGKTTVATNLAVALGQAGRKVTYIDCDVEEPNGRIFIKPVLKYRYNASVPVPRVSEDLCTHCGDCVEACEFNALSVLPDRVISFEELCHGCGACSLVCQEKAITEVPRRIGAVNTGRGCAVDFIEGRLNIGEAQAPPLIRAAKQHLLPGEVTILDAPPGTSCSVIEAVSDVQFVVLVTEPTPFGLHDLRLAVDMLKLLDIPHGVVINRDEGESSVTTEFCEQTGIEILMRLPYDRKIAEAYSRGKLLIPTLPEYVDRLMVLYDRITRKVAA